MKKTLFILFFVMVTMFSTNAFGKTKKAKFYDFSDQLINGEIKKASSDLHGSKNSCKVCKITQIKKIFYSKAAYDWKRASLKVKTVNEQSN